MPENTYTRPPGFEATISRKDKAIDWYVYCTACHKIIDHAVNGSMMEAAGKIHTNNTGHTVMVGLMIRLEERK